MVDVYLAGVGGQGIITASRIIGDAAINAGLNVLLSETHGMAQRGGSVVCTARIGDVHSPLIPDGHADVVLSFELLETMRALCAASKKTVVISSTDKMIPMSVTTGKLHYPTLEEVSESAKTIAKGFVPIDTAKLARDAGTPLSSNVVMVGALAGTGMTRIDREHYEKAIEANVPRMVRENLNAFANGFEVTEGILHKR
jgi:indolepyruvate ferredoxin oxidoreductase beta subunit